MSQYEYSPINSDELSADQTIVVEYWRSLKGDCVGPKWAEFDMMEIPFKLLPCTHVVDVIENGKDFLFRFYGTTYAEIHGRELSKKKVSDVQPPFLSEMLRQSIYKVLEIRGPIAQQAIVDPEKTTQYQTVVRLPLSDDGTTITHIVSLAEYAYNISRSRDLINKLMSAPSK